MTGSYFIGSLGIDIVNSISFAYVVSAILRKDFNKESYVLIAFCSCLSIGLTYYSFNMSQNSAFVLGNDIEQEKQKDDTDQLLNIDQELKSKITTIENDFSINYSRTLEPFKNQITNIESTFDNQILILRNEIAVIDANTTKSNYLYAAKQKKPITKKIQELETAKRSALSPILEKRQTAIDNLTTNKNKRIADAQFYFKNDRTRTQNKTDYHNSQVSKTSTIFSSLFGKLAGYAVFGLLLLAAIQEVLFFRNKIEPTPILSNFDFSPSWIIEVLSYPLVFIQRHSTNQVREWYADLPVLKEPVIQKEIFDGNSLDQAIVKPEIEKLPQRKGSANTPVGRPRNLKTAKRIFMAIPATSQYSHERENSRGLENYEEREEPTKTETHEKEKLINHIGRGGQEYWYNQKQVEGKVKKYRAKVRTWERKAGTKKATNRDKKALVNNRLLLGYWEGRLGEFY